MKKISTLLTFLLFWAFVSPLTLRADEVSRKEASRLASAFLNPGMAVQTAAAELPLLWDSRDLFSTQRTAAGNAPVFYVFGVDSGQGFIIVSAEDAVMPVLAYSLEDPMPGPDHLPVNLKEWMRGVSRIISAVRRDHLQASPEVRRLWSEAEIGKEEILHHTAKWGQDAPYNKFCPLTNGGEQTVTGCVATSTAIIMRYHSWPETGIGKTNEYLTATAIKVPSRDLEHVYHWDKMPLEVMNSSGNITCTPEEADEIALLMADVGATYQLDYGSNKEGGTAGSVENAIYIGDHFTYGPDMAYLERDKKPTTEWYDLLRAHLREYGPVLYRGASSDGSGGHAFVLDGVTDQNQFHINWGWDGYANGYFSLDLLDPLGPESVFSFKQGMMYGFRPNSEPRADVSLELLAPGLVAESDVLNVGDEISIKDVQIRNTSEDTFRGSILLAVLSSLDLSFLYAGGQFDVEILPGETRTLSELSFKIQEDTETDDMVSILYAPLFMPSSFTSISPADESTPNHIDLTILKDLEGTTAVTFDRGTESIRIKHQEGVEAEVLLGTQVITDGVMETDEFTLTIETSRLESGQNYTLRLINGKQIKEISFQVNPLNR